MRGSQALAHCRMLKSPSVFQAHDRQALFAGVSPFPPVSRAIPLCVTAAFGLVVFVDELLEFIEFGWSDALK